MRDKTPDVREWPLRVKASLLACTIFTALLIINMTMGREGKNFPELMLKMRDFVNLATLLPLNDLVIEQTIDLRLSYKKIKLGDAIVAATALVHKLVLVTRNTQDFKNIPGLSIINVHDLE